MARSRLRLNGKGLMQTLVLVLHVLAAGGISLVLVAVTWPLALTLNAVRRGARADGEAVARPVLRHRLVVNFTAEAEGVKSDDIITKLIALVKKEK